MTILGIDLGTTNSACSIWHDGEPTLIPNRLGTFLTPSVVGIDDEGELLVGETAKNRLVSHPKLTTSVFKRYMGTEQKVTLNKRNYSAIELSSLVLKSLKEDAEAFLGEPVTEAVISVPAYFNDIQRKATKAAGELAGLKVDRLINEPTAAAMVYGLHDREDGTQFIILDLGGGTFDVSLVEYFDGVLEVHASSGDNHLGGEDFLTVLANHYFESTGIQPSSLSPQEYRNVLHALEELKKALSNSPEPQTVEQLVEVQTEPWVMDRAKFENLSQPLLNRIILPIERTVNDADVLPAEIDEVVMVGGATRMPSFRSMVSKMFRRLPLSNIDPDLVVAMGAGIQAGLKDKLADLDDVVLTDVSPYSLGTGIVNEGDKSGDQGGLFLPIIERNTTVPVSIQKGLCTVNDNQTKLLVDIYQGESRLVKNNVYLGELEVTVPKNKAGEESIDVRYSYDMNGLLEVDVTVRSTGKKYNTSIMNSASELSEEDLKASKEKLAKLKFHPRDAESNRMLIARADRLFESALGDKRDDIRRIMSEFEQILERQIPEEISRAAKQLSEILDQLENDRAF